MRNGFGLLENPLVVRRRTTTLLRRAALVIGVALVVLGYLWQQGWRPWLTPAPGGLTIHSLDVGQGDSFLIRTPQGKAVLIDAGPPEAGDIVVQALRRYGVRQLDLVVATHPHADHIGGLRAVLDAIPVLRVLDSGQPYPTRTYTRLLEMIKEKGITFHLAEPGQRFELDTGITLDVLAPERPLLHGVAGSDENANSIVLRLVAGNFSMLFTGDSEAETERRLIESGAPLSAQVLKVAHHGSRYSTSREFLERVRPDVAILSCGRENDYGHPAQATLDRLRLFVREIHRTDLEGEITLIHEGRRYRIETEHAPTGDPWAGRRPRSSGIGTEPADRPSEAASGGAR
jgi:beta-lactamase superfamily II metal-dependent hydrolase